MQQLLTFAVGRLRGALGVRRGVVGARPAAGLAPLGLVEAGRTERAGAGVALPITARLARN